MNTHSSTGKRILAISGSLRAASSNSTLLRAAVSLAQDNMAISIYDGLGDLPHFNPDLDGESPPKTVSDFRRQLQNCDAVLICSPEYAHGVPGVLKNGLDWIVGSGEFMNKPVLLINASLTSTHAQASLTETLTVMMAKVQAVRIPLMSNKLGEEGILRNAEIAGALHEAIGALANAALASESGD